MLYKCHSCGSEFDTIDQLAAHKRMHQAGQQPASGIICLGCARRIPIEPSQANYSGPLTCPSCHQTMKVVLEDGEVVTARIG